MIYTFALNNLHQLYSVHFCMQHSIWLDDLFCIFLKVKEVMVKHTFNIFCTIFAKNNGETIFLTFHEHKELMGKK